MAIKLYPNRVFRSLPTPVDALMHKETVKQLRGVADITSVAMEAVVTPYRDWKVVGIKLTFSGATSRNYTVSVVGGRSVLANLNDFLFFQTERTIVQKITLDPGFYTGTELAAHLKSKMDANSAFNALGITFTVAYGSGTGNFSITPSSGNLKYIEYNTSGSLPDQYSIAGHLFGFNANTSFASVLTSDTSVAGLNSESAIITEVANTDLSHYVSDIHYLSLDEAIKVETNTASVEVTYCVDYQLLLT